MKVVRIFPRTNLHTYLRSDTLWGNLIYAYRMIYGIDETSELISKFLSDEVPFKISSIFPLEKFVENNQEKIIYYFPKPISGENLREAREPEEMAYWKEFKKVKYLEKDLFEEYLKGNLDDNLLFNRFYNWRKAKDDLNNNRSKYDQKKIDELYQIIENNRFKFLTELSPTFNLHNSIDRMNNSTLQQEGRGQLYWEKEFTFFRNKLNLEDKKVKGIFFLVEGKNDDLIQAPLRLLSHIGIGGNISIGKGSFDFEIDNFSFPQLQKFNSYVSLSLFRPSQDEIDKLKTNGIHVYYDLTTRIGKIGRDFNLEFQEKNPIICFTEGSTFFVKDSLKGEIVPTAKHIGQNDIYSNYLFFGVKANLRLQ